MKTLSRVPEFTMNVIMTLLRFGQFFVIVFIFYLLYKVLFEQVLDGSQIIWPLLGLWVVSAYIAIPRIHRILTKYYLPNYFVGRVRSPSGLLSDPVNLAFFGSEKDIHRAMQKAGWIKSDKLTAKTALRTVYASLLSRSYPSAPVGDMYLFTRRQDFAYEIEVNGSPNERHHVRFWKTPKGWRLPGGYEVDWLAAASYDTHVGIKIATGQIDHFIHSDIDEERDYIIDTLKKAKQTNQVNIVKHFSDAFHDHNNGGDRIRTDGSLPFITLKKAN
jgi:hypothetical protein